MEEDLNLQIKEKCETSKDYLINMLSYVSKSKKTSFDGCPFGFALNYVLSLHQLPNPFFKIGIDVHDFADKIFDIVEPQSDGSLLGISKLRFHPNMSYKKNVVKFEMERWQAINAAGFDTTYFFPTVKEKKWKTQNPKLVGIVDRVHKCFKKDVFAPPHPEFKDDDLVIVENKTGKPTAEKCKNYESDMLWYKIIMEIEHPELAPIRWGAIYFPYDNYVYHCELKIEDCQRLAIEIKKTREQFIEAVTTGVFPATPNSRSCGWCSYKNRCPYKI